MAKPTPNEIAAEKARRLRLVDEKSRLLKDKERIQVRAYENHVNPDTAKIDARLDEIRRALSIEMGHGKSASGPNRNFIPFLDNSAATAPLESSSNTQSQTLPDALDLLKNPGRYVSNWNKFFREQEEYNKAHPTPKAKFGKIRLRVHEGEASDSLWTGHSWLVIDWSDGRKESIELQPQGHFFGGGPQNDILANHVDKKGLKTIDRPYDNELVFKFDENKWKDLNSIINSVPNKKWTIFNNCTDMPIEVIKNLTGNDFGDEGPEMPGVLSKRMSIFKIKKKTKN